MRDVHTVHNVHTLHTAIYWTLRLMIALMPFVVYLLVLLRYQFCIHISTNRTENKQEAHCAPLRQRSYDYDVSLCLHSVAINLQ
jgi:hypothetical protein